MLGQRVGFGHGSGSLGLSGLGLSGLGLLGLGLLAQSACGPDRPPSEEGEGGSAGTHDSGGAGTLASGGTLNGGGAISGGGAASDGGASQAGTSTATGGVLVAECGNGVAELSEQCDGDDFGDFSCRALGYDEGSLSCDECEIDHSGCSGDESTVAACYDFRDNDGDRRVDCEDTECAEICAAPCVNAPDIGDPAVIIGTTVGRASLIEPSCKIGSDPTGPEVVFRFTAEHTGIVEASVASRENLTVSLRTTCDDESTELLCAFGVDLEREIVEGETVFVIVDGLEADTAGAFTLEVASRAIECGDGFRDGDEECDDGNAVNDDGCSAECVVEPAETEANDVLEDADVYQEPFYASIGASGDEDWVSFEVLTEPSAVAIDTFDYGDGACASQELDSLVELYDEDGSLLLSNDDGGEGYCARIVTAGLPKGTYFTRTLASPYGTTPVFPYRLRVDVDPCGNGRQAPGEECDDGNRTNWDGCSSTCELE